MEFVTTITSRLENDEWEGVAPAGKIARTTTVPRFLSLCFGRSGNRRQEVVLVFKSRLLGCLRH